MIGVMQGRLLPKYNGRYQAHPPHTWKQEFPLAKAMGLDCIEFILDYEGALENPLLRPGGTDEILSVSATAGVLVRTICADYFMAAPLHSKDHAAAARSADILAQLLASAARLGATDVVLPCVDQSRLEDEDAKDRLVAAIEPLLGDLERAAVNLSLETDLDPRSFLRLLDRFDSSRITVNYDTGNSASLGYDPVEELEAYGTRISDIHIKDRLLNGGSVILGTGDAPFEVFFDKLGQFDYQGPFIMQAYRDEEGLAVFTRQLEWIQPFLRRANSPRRQA